MINSGIEYSSLKNVSVVDSIKDWLIDQLIKGNLKPGDKLPTEGELCANLGAGRNSVREAIKQLEAYGVLYIRRADGTYVSEKFDPKMLSPVLYSLILQSSNWSDFVDLRRAIDIGTLYVLIDKHPDSEELKVLRDSLKTLEELVASADPDVKLITEADCAFHNQIIGMTKNPQLITLSEYINRLTVPSREKTTENVIKTGCLSDYIKLHRQLYNIVFESNKQEIEQAVLDHYVFWEKLTPA